MSDATRGGPRDSMKQGNSGGPFVVDLTIENFQQVFEQSFHTPVVVDFWAPWCAPCRQLGPTLERLAEEYQGKFILAKVDIDAQQQIAYEFGVSSIPAVFGIREQQIVDSFMGALPEPRIREWLTNILPSPLETLTVEAQQIESQDRATAEKKYREALAIDAEFVPARIGLARVLFALNRLAESQEILDRLAERGYLEPEAETVQSELRLRMQAADLGDVAQHRAAVQKEPKNWQARLLLAEALAAAGQFEEALDTCLHLVQVDRLNTGKNAREFMIDVFRTLGDDHPLTVSYRRQLSVALS